MSVLCSVHHSSIQYLGHLNSVLCYISPMFPLKQALKSRPLSLANQSPRFQAGSAGMRATGNEVSQCQSCLCVSQCQLSFSVLSLWTEQ